MTPPSPSIAGLIAELRECARVHSGGWIKPETTQYWIAADELEKLATADETRVRDISRLTIERDTARDELAAAKAIVDEQADDEGLWFIPEYAAEDYLQKALRRLHEAVEGKSSEECARAALQPKVETP